MSVDHYVSILINIGQYESLLIDVDQISNICDDHWPQLLCLRCACRRLNMYTNAKQKLDR